MGRRNYDESDKESEESGQGKETASNASQPSSDIISIPDDPPQTSKKTSHLIPCLSASQPLTFADLVQYHKPPKAAALVEIARKTLGSRAW